MEDSLVGARLGHFEITSLLGRGGMGAVYRATDLRLRREVAVKVLPEEAVRQPERLERFQREAEAVAALDHPNIVTIHSVEDEDGVHFITMQLVEGEKLSRLVPPSGMELDRLLEIAIPMAEAISLAHDRGITHRDLKPDNVMVTPEGRVKVLDFGLAKITDVPLAGAGATELPTAPITAEGRILGTVAYMSPEQAEGRAVDPRSDVFSLGVVLYELATGRRPFQGDTPISTISSILRDQPRPLTEVRGNLPRYLGRIVERCLAKDPERRYQTAKELRNDLEQLQREAASGQLTSAGTAVTGRPAARSGRRLSARVALAAGGGLVLLLALGFWALRDTEPERPAAVATSAPPSVAVVGFENLGDPEDPQQLGRMLMSLVTTDLAESGGLRVASTSKVLASLKRATGGATRFDAAVAAEAAELAGAETMLVGQLLDSEGRLLLTAELVDVASGDTRGSLRREVAGRTELFALAGAIADEVRAELRATRGDRETSSIDLAQALTESPEAYRHYAAGEVALHERRFTDAEREFGLAVKLDPTFALAYYRQSLAGSWSGSGDDRAVLERGLPTIGRLPARWQTLYRATLHYRKGEVGAAHALLSELVEEGTELPDAHNILGEIHIHYSRYFDHRATRRHFERALEIDPSFKLVFFHLLDSYLAPGDFPAAERLVARYREEDPEDRMVAFGEVRIAAARQDWAEAVRRGREALRRTGDTAWYFFLPSLARAGFDEELEDVHARHIESSAGYTRGLAHVLRAESRVWRGHFEEALADYERARPLLDPEGFPLTAPMQSMNLTAQSLVLEWLGRLDDAVASSRDATAADPWDPRARYELGRLLYATGRQAEGDRVLAEIERRAKESFSPYGACWTTLLRAVRSSTQGEPEAAFSTLAELPRADCDPSLQLRQLPVEGAVHELRNDLPAALAAYRQILDPPVPLTSTWNALPLDIPLLYDLARLEEAAGNRQAARAAYGRYLERWGNADLPIPEVARARERLAALE